MLRDRILVKPIQRKPSEIIATVLREKYSLGEVVAIGPGKYNKQGKHMPLDVKPGDIIRYGEFAFPEWEDRANGQRYQILQEADVAAIVE